MKAGVKYISVWVSPSEPKQVKNMKKLLIILLMICLHAASVGSVCSAALIDRIVAYVDDHAITLSEFQSKFEKLRKMLPNVTEEEAVNSMINNILLLRQAHRMRLEAASEDDLVKEYIDVRIRSRVFIKEEQLTAYYSEHKKELDGKDYLSVRDDIEKYLSELEINRQLKELLQELRKESNIVVQLKD